MNLKLQDIISGFDSHPEEERAHGTVSFRTYYEYFKTGGGYVFTLFVFGLLALAEVCTRMCALYKYYVEQVNNFFADWWIADWYIFTIANKINNNFIITAGQNALFSLTLILLLVFLLLLKEFWFTVV